MVFHALMFAMLQYTPEEFRSANRVSIKFPDVRVKISGSPLFALFVKVIRVLL